MHFIYSKWVGSQAAGSGKHPFEILFDIFQELLSLSGGDVSRAIFWLNQLDEEYEITDNFDEEYGMGDFIEELTERGYIRTDPASGMRLPTGKTGRSIREKALEEIFRKLKKGGTGNHKTSHIGRGLERQPESAPWKPGDDMRQLDSTGTLMNMLRHSTLDSFNLNESDLEVYHTDHYTSVSTVLLIDLSHSMILYGEDRITPARKVAMALSEMIMRNYAKDSLDIIAFGNEAWPITIDELPYLQAGPFHTNTLQALERARHILQRKRYSNKQIFMITDGKPSCMIEGGRMYKNSFGLDRKIVSRVLDEAVTCRRHKIDITTFMIAKDPYLQEFVKDLTEANKGRAYYATLDNLGGYIFEDYIRNRKKHIK